MYIKSIVLILFSVMSLQAEHYYKRGEKVELKPLLIKSPRNLNNKTLWYQTDNKATLGVNDRLFVKLKKNVSIQIYAKKYNLTLIKELGNNLYLLQTEDVSLTIDVSNMLYEEKGVLFSHPDFKREREAR